MWKLGSMPLMKTSLADPVWPLGDAKPLSGILPGRLLPARSALWTPGDLSNLMARSVFGEYWRIHVIPLCVLDSGISPEFTHNGESIIS
jgi:hypothetical protein